MPTPTAQGKRGTVDGPASHPGTWKQAGPCPGCPCSPILRPWKAVPRGWINESWGPILRCRWRRGDTLSPGQRARRPHQAGETGAPQALTLENALLCFPPASVCCSSSVLEAVKVAGALPASPCSQTASLPSTYQQARHFHVPGRPPGRTATTQADGPPLSCRGGRLPLPLGIRMFPKLLHPPPHPYILRCFKNPQMGGVRIPKPARA